MNSKINFKKLLTKIMLIGNTTKLIIRNTGTAQCSTAKGLHAIFTLSRSTLEWASTRRSRR